MHELFSILFVFIIILRVILSIKKIF